MNEKPPTVSVVIPTQNRAHLVGRAIRSVLNQTYENFEIIVMDDASTDNTEEVVKSFNDPRIRYIRHERNRGGSAARNTGIRAARGEYIAFLDSDDEWLPEKLAKQVLKLAELNDKVALVYNTGESIIDSETGRCLKKKISTIIEGDVHDRLLEGDFIGSCSSVLVKKSVILAASGFDEQLVSRQDWDCWLRVTQEHQISCVPECLILRNIGQDRMSTKLARIVEGTKALIEKHQHDMRRLPRVYGKQLAIVACMELNLSRRDGWKTAWKAVRAYPLQPKLYVALMVSIFGKRLYRCVYFSWKKGRNDLYVGRAQVQ